MGNAHRFQDSAAKPIRQVMKRLDSRFGYLGEVFPQERLERSITLVIEELKRMRREVRVVPLFLDGVDRANLFKKNMHVQSVRLNIEERPRL